MPLLFNYLRIPDCFIRLDGQFRKKLNIKYREFELILQMIAMEINLTITMTYLQLETKIMHYRNRFRNRFFDSNWQRKTPTVILCTLFFAL